MANNERVVPILGTQPKTVRRDYRGHSYIIKYYPVEQVWGCEVLERTRLRHPGTQARQIGRAERSAKRFIDKIVDGE